MYEILSKETLNENVKRIEVSAPLIAEKAKAGQFVIVRVDDEGERIPFTVADTDPSRGTVTIIFQEVGKSTVMLGELNVGDSIKDFAGPLGNPSHLEGIGRAAVIGGGLGCAIAYPQAKALHKMGAKVDVIAGFRTKDLVILEEEMKAVSERLIICTDDGSYGEKGLVTGALEREILAGEKYDTVLVIGPLVMMKFVALLTKKYGVKTICSMNPIMIDGTGMCGGCRLTVGGKVKFACVDGPEFDAHEVDFDEAIRRGAIYRDTEAEDLKKHRCKLTGQEK